MDLDHRFEWIETTSIGSAEPTYVRGLCRHLDSEREDVWSLDYTLTPVKVASLCRTCDAQLPPREDPMIRAIRNGLDPETARKWADNDQP